MINSTSFATPLVSQTSLKKSAIETLYEFFNTNINGRILLNPPQSGVQDGGRLQYDFQSTAVYNNPIRHDNGLQYYVVWSVIQTIYKVKDGQRVLPGEKKDRMGVTECQVREAKSVPGKIIGFCRSIGNSIHGVIGSGYKLSLELQSEKLIMNADSFNFSDYFAATQSGYKPTNFSSVGEFTIENGKLVLTTKQSSIDLDPTTLEELLGTENTYTIVSKEQ